MPKKQPLKQKFLICLQIRRFEALHLTSKILKNMHSLRKEFLPLTLIDNEKIDFDPNFFKNFRNYFLSPQMVGSEKSQN